jgi:hypothetical protein
MDEMATPAQVAEALHTTEASLAQMRYRGDGPVFARCGRRRVLYRWCDVAQWVEESLHSRTDRAWGSSGRSTTSAPDSHKSNGDGAGSPANRNRDGAGRYPTKKN